MDHESATRAVKAETEAFVDLYRAAAESWDTAHDSFDSVRVVWSPHDPDPAFSVILNLFEARQYETTIEVLESLGRQRGMPRIGINGNPAVDRWVEQGRAAALGFETASEEYFWARPLDDEIDVPALSPGATIERSTAGERDLWGRTLNLGHDYPEHHARGHVYAAAIGRPGWLHYLIRVDAEPAAASVLYIAGDSSQLFVTATRPEFRSRGFQTYFIARRLHDARAAGCTLAATQTVVDNASPRNMERRGFTMLYRRKILSKPL
jgi:hypothetical protein